LRLNGRLLTALPLEDRRALLHGLPFEEPIRQVALLDDENPWERARREGWEGVIAKRRGSPYEHRRSKHWLKMKCELSQEFVVGGFTDPRGARVGLGALLVGHYEGNDLVFAGKLGTGFNTELLLDLRRRDRAAGVAVYESHRLAATGRALGTPGNRRAGRVHRVDLTSQAAAPAPACGRPGHDVRVIT
jgi:ATP-dependent DNA ligase